MPKIKLPNKIKSIVDGFGKIVATENIQELWSGYGHIKRIKLEGKEVSSLILKSVRVPEGSNHPRGWSSDFAHQRKIKSYHVETNWYERFNYRDESCRIPKCLGSHTEGENFFLLMEDLDSSGFPRRPDRVGQSEIEICVKWLANFHARFMHTKPEGLWQIGTYWHLDTRPEELERLEADRLKLSAALIDKKLSRARNQTLVHGDAKLANFCFSQDLDKVAAVDFQYTGGGCGMKDLAYFMSSCLDSDECFEHEEKILQTYFTELKSALPQMDNFEQVEKEWRELYVFAWADFYRFLKGWSPEHWKVHEYSERQAAIAQNQILEELTKLAQEAAVAAGRIIQNSIGAKFKISHKPGPSEASSVVTEVDHLAQDAIILRLKESIGCYGFGLLTEEMQDDLGRLKENYFWCVDPLDGTLRFSNNLPGYAVSIALVEKSGAPLLGVVYDPAKDNIYHANMGGGAFKNGEVFSVNDSASERPTLFADKSLKSDSRFTKLKEKFEILFEGGAVMNSIWCLEKAPAIYMKYPKKEKGGGSIWDFAAVSLIVNEAGGLACDMDGRPLDLNRPDSTFMNHRGVFIASAKALKDLINHI